MIEVNKSYEMGFQDVFKLSKGALLRMKCEIKYENIDHGLIVAFLESLTSFPSGELIFIKLGKEEKGGTKIDFSSESMAINSRLFKKKANKKNAADFFKILESNL